MRFDIIKLFCPLSDMPIRSARPFSEAHLYRSLISKATISDDGINTQSIQCIASSFNVHSINSMTLEYESRI